MTKVDIGLREVVEAAGIVGAAAVIVTKSFLCKLNTLACRSAKYVGAEITVTERKRPTFPTVILIIRFSAITKFRIFLTVR